MQAIQPVPLAKGICIGLQLFSGDHSALISEQPPYKDISVTQRLTFGDIFLPGMQRNDFYLTLEEGDFSQEASAKSLEVIVQVRRDNGEPVKVRCIDIYWLSKYI